MRNRCLALCLVLLVLTFGIHCKRGAVYYIPETGVYEYVESTGNSLDSENLVAAGEYDELVNQTGWGDLYIATHKEFHNDVQAYHAGYVEGSLMAERIYQMFMNIFMYNFGSITAPPAILKFFQQQYAFVEQEIVEDPINPIWQGAMYLINQTTGLMDGYNSVRGNFSLPKLDFFDIYIVNSAGDLEDLNIIFNITTGQTPLKKQLWLTDCSGLVKLAKDFSDVFVGQTTWRSYTAMLRTYKHYTFAFTGPRWNSVSFSSSPGFISSKDDFYTMDNGLVTLETTNSIFNEVLYNKVTPRCLLCWQRTMIANGLAQHGAEWMSIFGEMNSGTYNNQWMIVDLNKFTPGKAPSPGFFNVLEQIPGKTDADDMTSALLRQMYWPSYNIPYFDDIYNESGYYDQYKKKGDAYSYSECPRAKIFRRDQSNVNTIESMKTIMQYNKYETDPLSMGQPSNAIASRYDLRKENAAAFGAIDSKVTSFKIMSSQDDVVWSRWAYAISGPTKDNQPAFSWNGPFQDQTHAGQPEKFDFDWQFMKPI